MGPGIRFNLCTNPIGLCLAYAVPRRSMSSREKASLGDLEQRDLMMRLIRIGAQTADTPIR